MQSWRLIDGSNEDHSVMIRLLEQEKLLDPSVMDALVVYFRNTWSCHISTIEFETVDVNAVLRLRILKWPGQEHLHSRLQKTGVDNHELSLKLGEKAPGWGSAKFCVILLHPQLEHKQRRAATSWEPRNAHLVFSFTHSLSDATANTAPTTPLLSSSSSSQSQSISDNPNIDSGSGVVFHGDTV